MNRGPLNASPARPASKGGRKRLVTRASGLALACGLVWAAQPAQADGFQGTHNVALGNLGINQGTNDTTIFVNSAQSIIDWTINSNGTPTFDFLPTDKTAQFVGFVSDFTVLNRITDANLSNTPLVSLMGDISTNTSGLGSVWFYAPGGLFVGPDAVFNVGSLLLTANPIETDGDTTLFGSNGEWRFRGTAGSLSTVSIATGAVIETNVANSYVALVAPRVNQSGTIRVDGSTALVAAEEVDITFNAGLFDITVTQGTTDTTGIQHTGSTGGPGTIDISDVQRVVMMAVPKNLALTMLLSGNIGYDAAVSVNDDQGAVILSGGFDLAGDNHFTRSAGSTGAANISISDATFTSQVGRAEASARAVASGTISIASDLGGDTQFQKNTYFHSETGIAVSAAAGKNVLFDGTDTRLSAHQTSGGFQTGVGGSISFSALGTIAAAGSLDMYVQGFVDSPAPILQGRPGAGGSIDLLADGGTISAAGTMNLNLIGAGESAAETGGDGIGGTLTLTVQGGGSIGTPDVVINANGFGNSGQGIAGGKGTGGSVTLNDNGGLFDFPTLAIMASGFGSDLGPLGGDAAGGHVTLNISGATQTWNSLNIDAGATAGLGNLRGGSAIVGSSAISLVLSGAGSIEIADDVTLNANAIVSTVVGSGGIGAAGGISFSALNGAVMRVDGNFTANANAMLNPDSFAGDGFSPAMFGGSATVLATGGSELDLFNIFLSADAASAIGAMGSGAAHGGTIEMGATNGGIIGQTQHGEVPTLRMRAVGFANAGPFAADGIGGTVRLYVQDGTISTPGDIRLDAGARIGDQSVGGPGVGGTVQGGTASIEMLFGPGGGSITAGATRVWAEGNGRAFDDGIDGVLEVNGDGGDAEGGLAFILQQFGTLTLTTVDISADGWGTVSARNESGSTGFTAGNGAGGNAGLNISGGTANVTSVSLSARGSGGGAESNALAGQGAAHGGDGLGGGATFTATGGTFTATGPGGIMIDANGVGGNGMSSQDTPPGDGGAGTGGTAQIQFNISGIIGNTFVTTPGATLFARGIAGAAGSASGTTGQAKLATGGQIYALFRDAGFSLANMTLDASAMGGMASTGGSATGGLVDFWLEDFDLTSGTLPNGFARTLSSLSLLASSNATTGQSGSGISIAGAMTTRLLTGIAGTGLTVSGNFSATATGGVPRSGNAFLLDVSSQPFLVQGSSFIQTVGPVNIAASDGTEAPFHTVGNLTVNTPMTVTGTGRIIADGSSIIDGNFGIALEKLRTGGTTSLVAGAGTVVVSVDLQSVGDVTVGGQSIDLTSAGSVAFGALTSASDVTLTLAGSGRFHNALTVPGILTISTGGLGAFDGIVSAASATIDIGTTAQFDGTLSTNGALRVTSGGNASFASNVSGDDLTMDIGGDATFAQSLGSFGTLDITTGGDASFQSLFASSGTMRFDIGGDARFNLPVEVSDSVTLVTGGSATFVGSVSAPMLSFDIGTDAIFQGLVFASDQLGLATGGAASFGGVVAVDGPARFDIGTTATFADRLDASELLTVVTGGDATFGERVIGNGGADLTIGGAATFTDNVGAATDLIISTVGDAQFGGTVEGLNIALDIGGSASFQSTINTPGTLNLKTGGTGDFTGALNGVDIILDIGDGAEFGSNIETTGDLNLSTGGNSLFNGFVTGDAVTLLIGGDASFAQLLSASGELGVSTLGNASFAAPVSAGTSATFNIGGDLDFGDIVSLNQTLTVTTGGSADFVGLITANAVTLDIGTELDITEALQLPGALDIETGGLATFHADVSASSISTQIGGDVSFLGTLGASTLSIGSVGDATFTGAVSASEAQFGIGGDLAFQEQLSLNGDLTVRTGGAATFATPISGGTIIFDIGTDLTLPGELFASGSLLVSTGNDARFGGDVFGVSGDFEIGGAADFRGNLSTETSLRFVTTGDALFAGTLSASGLDLTTGGSATFGGRVSGDTAFFDIGQDATFSSGLSLSDNLEFSSGGDAHFTGLIFTDGTFQVGGSAEFESGMDANTVVIGSAGLVRFGGVTVDALTVDAGGEIIFGDPVNAAGDITATTRQAISTNRGLSAANILLDGGSLTLDGSIAAREDITLRSAGNAIVSDIEARNALTANFGGEAEFTGLVHADGALAIRASQALDFKDFVSGNSVSITSDTGRIRFSEGVTSGTTLGVRAQGDIQFGGIVSGQLVEVNAGGSAIFQDDVSASAVINVASGSGMSFGGAVTGGGQRSFVSGAGLNFADRLETSGALIVRVTGGANFTGEVKSGATDIETTGNISFGNALSAANALRLKSGGSGDFTGALVAGSLALDIGSDARFGGILSTPGQLTLKTGGSGTFTGAVTGNPVTLNIGTTASFAQGLSSGSTLDLRTGGQASLQTVNAGSGTSLNAGGNLAIAGNVTTGGSLGLVSGGALTLGGTVSSSGLSVSAATDVTFAQDQNFTTPLNLTVNGNLVFDGKFTGTALGVTSGGDTRFNGGLSLTGALTVNAGRDVSFTAAATVGSATISATRDALFNAAFDGLGDLDVRANGLARFTGPTINSTQILIRSADIDIGENTLLGSLGRTTSLVLQPRDTVSTVFVGGAARTGGYSLSNAEFARLRSSSYIEIGQSGAQMEVGDLTISAAAGGQLGGQGRLVLSAPQSISVTGKIDFTAPDAAPTLVLEAPLIRVHRDTGGINLHGADSSLQGRLIMRGERIEVASEAAFADLANLTDLAAISARMGVVEGTASQEGALRAGRITISADNRLLIQNSGASTDYADRRGFTANTLEVLGSSRSTVAVAINGRLTNSTGGFFTGLATLDQILFGDVDTEQRSLGFLAPLSSVNGCAVGVDCAAPMAVPVGALPPADTIAAIVKSAPTEPDAFQMTPIQLGDSTVLDTGPIVDEPVTSVGNDDLWQSGCDPSSPEGCSSAGE